MIATIRFLLVTVVILAIGGVIYYAFASPWSTGSTATANSDELAPSSGPGPDSGPSLAELEQQAADRLKAKLEEDARKEAAEKATLLAAARVRHIEANGRLNDARRALKELNEAMDRWTKGIAGLESNQSGRLISVDPIAVQTYLSTCKVISKLDGPTVADRLRGKLDALAPLIEDEPSVSYVVSDETLTLVADQQEQATSLSEKYEAAIDTIRGLVAKGRTAGATTSRTLAEAIRNLQADQAALVMKDVEQRTADLREKEVARLEQVERDAAARQDLIREAQSSHTKRLLAFFLTPGRYDHKTRREQDIADPKPVSFSLLEQRGALEDSEEGIKRLLYICCDRNDKDRPYWPPWYNYRWERVEWDQLTPTLRKQIANVQDKLRRLGPTMVELGMLAP